MLSGEFIDGVIKDQNFVTLLGVLLQDRASENRFLGVSREVKNSVLVVLHAADVLVEGDETFRLLSGVESEQLGQFCAVRRILDNTKFDVLSEVIPENLILVFAFILFILIVAIFTVFLFVVLFVFVIFLFEFVGFLIIIVIVFVFIVVFLFSKLADHLD